MILSYRAWQIFLIHLYKSTFSNKLLCLLELSKKADITYTHTFSIKKELEKRGLVLVKKSGRSIFLILTSKGMIVAKNLNTIYNIIENNK